MSARFSASGFHFDAETFSSNFNIMKQAIIMKAAISLLTSLGLCVSASAGTFATMSIDGVFTDWAGIPVVDSDGGDNAGSVDIGDVQIANDDDFLYLSVTFPNTLSSQVFISLDIDNDTATGFDVFSLGLAGSDAAWQNDFAFAQSAGVFNSGALAGDHFGGGHALISALGDAAQKEWAISLDATFATGGAPVFPDDDFTVLIWTDQGAGDVSAPIAYTLATIPEPSSAVLALLSVAGLALRRRR